MPFALIALGAVFVLSGVNDTYSQLGSQFSTDIHSGFLKWSAAILIIGALGYIQDLRAVANAFLTLIIVAIVLSTKGGVFTGIQNAVSSEAGSTP